MKIFIVFALAALAAAAPSTDSLLKAVLQAKFNTFKAQHGKTYASLREEQVRLQNFIENTHLVETHNERYSKGLETFYLENNDMSDMSFEEYVNTRLSPVRPVENITAAVYAPQFEVGRPASIDWRSSGAVNKVKNQGGCGSCYAFAAVGSMESAFFRKHGRMLDLAEQQLVDCAKGHGPQGCHGGWMHDCFRYVKDNGGINEQHNYRYEAREGSCRYNRGNAAVRVTGHVMIPRDNEGALADAVGNVGPVAIAYDASTREFQLYKGGIYHSNNCDKMRTSHAVLAVGYGTENGTPFWILKNSWGASWGEGGYFRMRRDTGNKCGIATFSSYPIVA